MGVLALLGYLNPANKNSAEDYISAKTPILHTTASRIIVVAPRGRRGTSDTSV